MILDKEVKIKFKGNSKISFYKDLGYDIISGKDFYVLVKDLLPTSTSIVQAKCDFCENIVFVTYKNYYRNFNRSSHGKYSCSKSCSNKKTEKTNLEKYGYKNPNSSQIVKEKKKKTNLERYGSQYTFNNELIKEKIKNTNLEKYGKENPFSSNEIISKICKTNLEKYGYKNPASSEFIKEKIKNTNLEKYGNIFFFKTDKFTNNLIEYKDKIKKSHIKSIGIDHPMKNDFFRKKFKICNDENYIEYKGDSVSIFECDKGHTFEINSDNYRSRNNNNITLCTLCYPIGEQTSIKEKELLDFIKKSYKGVVLQSYRDNLEIDIYLPDLKLGFEFNGLYWHSEEYNIKIKTTI